MTKFTAYIFFRESYGFRSCIWIFNPFRVNSCIWCKKVVEFHYFAWIFLVFPTPFIEETVFIPQYILTSFVVEELTNKCGFASGLSVLSHGPMCPILCLRRAVLTMTALYYFSLNGTDTSMPTLCRELRGGWKERRELAALVCSLFLTTNPGIWYPHFPESAPFGQREGVAQGESLLGLQTWNGLSTQVSTVPVSFTSCGPDWGPRKNIPAWGAFFPHAGVCLL